MARRKEYPLGETEREELGSILLSLSQEGLRVLAVAERRVSHDLIKTEDVRDLAFVGFFGMKDALRPEVAAAMEKAISAGMRVVMITGDHEVTAKSDREGSRDLSRRRYCSYRT